MAPDPFGTDIHSVYSDSVAGYKPGQRFGANKPVSCPMGTIATLHKGQWWYDPDLLIPGVHRMKGTGGAWHKIDKVP